jgi:hypothetical protein
MVLCKNHQTQLVKTACINAISAKMLSNMFCAAKFLRVGGHLLRLIAGLREMLPRIVQWVPLALQVEKVVFVWVTHTELQGEAIGAA